MVYDMHRGTMAMRHGILLKNLIPIVLGSLSLLVIIRFYWLERTLHLMQWNPTIKGYLIIGTIIVCLLIVLSVIYSIMCLRRATPLSLPVLILSILIFTAAGVSYALFLSPALPRDQRPIVLCTPLEDRRIGYTIAYQSRKNEESRLLYSVGSPTLEHEIRLEGRRRVHRITLPELGEGVEVYYEVSTEGRMRSFTTGKGYPLAIAVSSDAHFGAGSADPSASWKILNQVYTAEKPFELMVNIGDIVEYGQSGRNYDRAIDALSNISHTVPMIHVPGNHDLWFSGIWNWPRFFSPTPESDSGGLYGRIDPRDDVHLLYLDLEWGIELFEGEQSQWLRKQLSSIPKEDLTIIFHHAFLYASSRTYDSIPWYDNRQMIDTLEPLYEASGVDLVFSGHNHQFEHIERETRDYLIVGSFGGKRDKDPLYLSEDSVYLDLDNLGYASLLIDEQQYTVSFIDQDGRILHDFTRSRR